MKPGRSEIAVVFLILGTVAALAAVRHRPLAGSTRAPGEHERAGEVASGSPAVPLPKAPIGPGAALAEPFDAERVSLVATGKAAFEAADGEHWARQPGLQQELESWYRAGRPHRLEELAEMTGYRPPLSGCDGTAQSALAQLVPLEAIPQPELRKARHAGNLMVMHLMDLARRRDRAGHLAFTRVTLAYVRDVERGMGNGPTLITAMIRVALEMCVMRHLRSYAVNELRDAGDAQAYVDMLSAYAAEDTDTLAALEPQVATHASLCALRRAVLVGTVPLAQIERRMGAAGARAFLQPGALGPEELRAQLVCLSVDAGRNPALAPLVRRLELAIPPEDPGVLERPNFAAAVNRFSRSQWHRMGTEIVFRLRVFQLARGHYPVWLDELERPGPPLPRQAGLGRPYEYHLLSGDRVELPAPVSPPFDCEPLWPAR